MQRTPRGSGGNALVHAIGKVGFAIPEKLECIIHRFFLVDEEVVGIQYLRHGVKDFVFVEPEAAAKDPFELQEHGDRHEQLLPRFPVSGSQTRNSVPLRQIVPNHATDQDIRVDGAHQRKGFMSSIDTVSPSGGVRIP